LLVQSSIKAIDRHRLPFWPGVWRFQLSGKASRPDSFKLSGKLGGVSMNEASSRNAVPQAPVAPAASKAATVTTAAGAGQNAARDAEVTEAARLRATGAATSDVHHDATHPAVTGTDTGDNRDETGDSATGATLGGVGGALAGALAGSIAGPAGAAAGAVVGALTGAGASGLAVDAIDRVDNDATVTGVGESASNAVPTRDQTQTDPDFAAPIV
jgi:hypothetical protein